jgi:hypothetical protein
MSSLASSCLTKIIRYPGECIVFNMLQSSRVKKSLSATIVDKRKNDQKEKISQAWENEEATNNCLIIRLIFSSSYPWTVAHQGIHEIFKGPLCLPILYSKRTDKKKVTIFLRDFANRGKNCISRKFYLNFSSIAEATAFVVAHNSMLAHYRAQQPPSKTTQEKRMGGGTNELSSFPMETKTEEHSGNQKLCSPSSSSLSLLHEPSKKKRKLDDENNKEEEKKKKPKLEEQEEQEDDNMYEAEEEYKETNGTYIAMMFKSGDQHNMLDDGFQETQDPFADLDD